MLSSDQAGEFARGRERATAGIYLGGGFLISGGVLILLLLVADQHALSAGQTFFDVTALAVLLFLIAAPLLGIPLLIWGAIRRTSLHRRETAARLENLGRGGPAAPQATWQQGGGSYSGSQSPLDVPPGPPSWGRPPS